MAAVSAGHAEPLTLEWPKSRVGVTTSEHQTSANKLGWKQTIGPGISSGTGKESVHEFSRHSSYLPDVYLSMFSSKVSTRINLAGQIPWNQLGSLSGAVSFLPNGTRAETSQ
ncbi:hypothetical protein LZ554_008930 [Drepanopeziza brunnea f. sp. 'monogermtubi']|nr:hypothetical protein LZ554_008930 [Drepanopeziza brunnea f. sp. 'monogermtubi']